MRWYGALQEGPTGVYTVMATNFTDGISGGVIADSEVEHVTEFLGFVDWVVARGDSITLLTDRLGRLFRPGDPPTLWRTLVEKYAPAYYEARQPYGDEQTAYVVGSAMSSEHFDEAVSVVLVEPGSFLAMHRYLNGEPEPSTTDRYVRAGGRAATDPTVVRFLGSGVGHPPSSQDVYSAMTGGREFSMGLAEANTAWVVSMTPDSPEKPDVAEFHLQYAENVAKYEDIGENIALKFAVLDSCVAYSLGLRLGPLGRSKTTGTDPGLSSLLPIALPEIPDNLWRVWTNPE